MNVVSLDWMEPPRCGAMIWWKVVVQAREGFA